MIKRNSLSVLFYKHKGSFFISHVANTYIYFKVVENVCGSLTEVMVETHRRRHLAYLMADHGALINPDHSTNLPKQQLNRWEVMPLSVSLYFRLVSYTSLKQVCFGICFVFSSSLYVLRTFYQRMLFLNFRDFMITGNEKSGRSGYVKN